MCTPWDSRGTNKLTMPAIALLRHGPHSLHALAETLGLNPEQTQNILQRLSRKVGIVRLFRYNALRYGLAE